MATTSSEKRLNQLAREYEQDYKDCKDLLTDEAVMALPHPLRTLANPAYRAKYMIGAIAGFENEKLMTDLFAQGFGNNHIWVELDKTNSPEFAVFITANSSGRDGGYNGGASGATFHLLRHQVTGGRQFTIDDRLVELLAQTDIDLDIPITDIHLPFPNIYIELGRNRNAKTLEPLALYNRVSGYHAFEGAYVSQTFTGEEKRPTIEITLTGSPLGHTEIGDDAVEWVSMDLSKPRTVQEALSDAFNLGWIVGSVNPQTNINGHSIEEYKSQALPDMGKRLEMVLKALLYISLPDLREQLIQDRTEARKVLARSQSGSHKRKAMRQMMRSRDTVLIMAPSMVEYENWDALEGESHVTPHWRRGHFRRQRHGVALVNTKVIWITPRLVNASLLNQLSDTPIKNYVVK